MDEEFTMGIVQHNYSNLIYISHLDVHPPLYYLILKIFLQISTFWTNSMFIQVIFSRIFSIIIGIIGFYFLCKIVSILNVKINFNNQIILYLFIPSVLFYLTTIRMYELAATFIIIELYELVLSYKNRKNNKNIILAVIFASLASYTHYFAAVSAGLFLFTFFITSIIYRNKLMIKKYFISGISFLLLFIPLLPFVLSQFKYESGSKVNYTGLIYEIFESFAGVVSSEGLLRKLFILVIVLMSIYAIYWSFKNLNNDFNLIFVNILANFIFLIFIAIFMAIYKNTPFYARYTYPIFSIYSFFIILICSLLFYKRTQLSNYLKSIIKSLLLFTGALLVLNVIKSTKNNINFFVKPSIVLMNNVNKWEKTNNSHINVTLSQYPTNFGEPLYIAQSSVYLNSINKIAVIKNNNKEYIITNLLAHDNKKLFNKLFNNIYFDNYK